MDEKEPPPLDSQRAVVIIETGTVEWEFRSQWMDQVWANYLHDWLADGATLKVKHAHFETAREGDRRG
ncbi:MAG: hypothetical protein ABSG37_07790 [Candidatus Limnocylindrales bacterium]